jgi:vacuolar-type H+-ATPase subunit I/STV1
MNQDMQCPIDHVKVNENKIRIIALLVLLMGIGFLLTGYNWLIMLLVYDFFVRAFFMPKLSLLGVLANVFVKLFKVAYKPTDRGPKRFAAGMGFVFVAMMLIAAIMGWVILLLPLAIVLCVFACLEAFAGLCVGCYVYTGLQKVKIVG